MILVTTTGKVGSRTARLLADAGQHVRVVSRRPEAHQNLTEAGVEVLAGDLDDPATIAGAVAGVTSVVLVTTPSVAQETAVVEALREQPAHITKITADASPDSPIARRRDHHRIEQALTASGLPHTLLRANAYMQNVLMLAPVIAARSAFSSPAADGRVGMVDARDVAEVAATIAAAPAEHTGTTYRLTGPRALSYDDVAAQLSELTGRTITHQHITAQEQEEAMVRMGLPEPVAHANALALKLFADGDADWTSPDVQRVTGRPPRTFTQFATDHISLFTGAPTRA
ncbi:NmrA family NAD(P)-binding protein [Actinoplanes sp. CA-131856]